MPNYKPRNRGSWSINSNVLGWGVLGLSVVIVGSFLLGMYIGYYQGLESNQSETTNVSKSNQTKNETDTTSTDTKADTSKARKLAEEAITEDQLRYKSKNNQTENTQSPQTNSNSSENTTTKESVRVEPIQNNQTNNSSSEPSETDESTEEQTTIREIPSANDSSEASPPDTPYFTINVTSTQKESRANDISNELTEAGYDPKITEADVNGVHYYRVRIGKFPTRTKASNFAEKLKDTGLIGDYWIPKILSE